jgi:hypothetical protein
VNAVEWTDLASVPVYPLTVLRRIDSSVRLATLRGVYGSHGMARTARRALANAVAVAYPGSLDDVRIKPLPALRAVMLCPVSVGHDLLETPVPALVLEAVLRARRVHRTDGIRRYYAATYRGYDHYVTSPAGLLTCGHVDSVPPAATFIDTLPRPRHDTLRPPRTARFPLNPGDRAAMVIIGVALVVHLTPEGGWTHREVSPGTDATEESAPDHPATSKIDAPPEFAVTVQKLTEIVPGLTLRSIQRTESGYQLTGRADRGYTDTSRLTALPGVTAVRVSTNETHTEIYLEGEAP